ncbi:hypothetical protein, partial [Bacillus sp. JJ722]|uniref:hypothetical protein n=1 Tax=Bacillus sp. JJ722 TaxID=3122973 RepID=UPI002FFD927E
FNIVSGLIIFSIMILQLVEGSNNLPYYLMALFLVIYFAEIKFKSFRKAGIALMILFDIFALWLLLPYAFAP